MAFVKTWEISNALWEKAKPLIPVKQREKGRKYQRAAGAGRPPIKARKVFAGICFVLRTGIQWKALPKEFGSASAVHRYFQEWQEAGFFEAFWRAGLAEYDEMQGIAWEWQSVDGQMNKAPLATECVGPNPTDRGKKWTQEKRFNRRPWCPAVDRRQRSQSTRLKIA
jgi:transposase